MDYSAWPIERLAVSTFRVKVEYLIQFCCFQLNRQIDAKNLHRRSVVHATLCLGGISWGREDDQLFRSNSRGDDTATLTAIHQVFLDHRQFC